MRFDHVRSKEPTKITKDRANSGRNKGENKKIQRRTKFIDWMTITINRITTRWKLSSWYVGLMVSSSKNFWYGFVRLGWESSLTSRTRSNLWWPRSTGKSSPLISSSHTRVAQPPGIIAFLSVSVGLGAEQFFESLWPDENAPSEHWWITHGSVGI